MPSYAVDSKKQLMIATGVVGIVQEWAVLPDGSRRPSETQARDEASGFPLWNVEVLYQQTSFGRVSSTTAMVAVGAVDQPLVATLAPVQFDGLRVEVRLTKAKALVESWVADGLAGAVAPVKGARSGADA